MDQMVEIDATVGAVIRRDMTPEESAAHSALQAAVAKRRRSQQDEDDARDVTLALMAQKLGVPADALRSALRLGPGKKPA